MSLSTFTVKHKSCYWKLSENKYIITLGEMFSIDFFFPFFDCFGRSNEIGVAGSWISKTENMPVYAEFILCQ